MQVSSAVSDLFFMVDNKDYFDKNVSEAEREAFLKKTAKQFASILNRLSTSYPITPDMVISNFKPRLSLKGLR